MRNKNKRSKSNKVNLMMDRVMCNKINAIFFSSSSAFIFSLIVLLAVLYFCPVVIFDDIRLKRMAGDAMC